MVALGKTTTLDAQENFHQALKFAIPPEDATTTDKANTQDGSNPIAKFDIKAMLQKLNNNIYIYPIICMLVITLIVAMMIISFNAPKYLKFIIILLYISLVIFTVFMFKK